VKLHTSEDLYLSGGLTAFSIAEVELQKIVDHVRKKYNIVVRTVGSKEKGTFGIRVYTPIYVSFNHVDIFVKGVRRYAASQI